MYAVSSRHTQRGIQQRAAEAQGFIIAQERARRDEERAEARRRQEAELVILEEIAARRKKVADDMLEANRILSKLRGGSNAISMNQIVTRICKALKVSREELLSDRRHKHIAFARQAIMYWTCRRTRLSLPEIGRRMGRDHTSIIHGKNVYPQKRAKMGRTLRPVR